MDWIFTSLHWYTTHLLLGVIFFPLTQKILAKFFPDLGYAFSKIIAILFLSYALFSLGILKILTFNQTGLIFLIILAAFLNLTIFQKDKLGKKKYDLKAIFLIIFEELLFLAAFLFWVYVRGQEPSIRGLEKFMDFGFINSLLRSDHFPPLDIWLSAESGAPNGFFINYYYFGHLTGAFLIKLTGIKAEIGYNLILASTFALTVTQSFSLVVAIINHHQEKIKKVALSAFETIKIVLFGLMGSFIVSLAGNFHTIYLFTKGYPNEKPVPFWEILSWYNPTKYWYPNATRFIPNTIHEFPSYSWVVADMHGHVFDIPYVLLTLAVLLLVFLKLSQQKKLNLKKLIVSQEIFFATIFIGFLSAVHYMTNAFDGPIYILLTTVIFLYFFRLTKTWFFHVFMLIFSFVIFSLPFSLHFKPFVTGIGVNCSPVFLTNLTKLGPFLFEKGNCQISPIWMLFVLWGFFWLNFIIFLLLKHFEKKPDQTIDAFIFILFAFGTFLIIIPEFFYIKDIYPAHFRANTMFKLGYQAFIMMGIASTYIILKIKTLQTKIKRIFSLVFILAFILVALYPLYSIPSYYGQLDRPVELDGGKWMENATSNDGLVPEDKEIIDYLNANVKGQPNILEAQGDSYTDFERISAYTGLPTVAGWWVHEWLWRGSAEVVGRRIPDIVNIYESEDLNLTKNLLNKYEVSYVIVSKMEKKKYVKINQDKFKQIGKVIFRTSNNEGAIYQVD